MLASIGAMMAIGLMRSTLAETAGRFSDAMHILKSFIASLVLLAFLSRLRQDTDSGSSFEDGTGYGQTENAESALAMDSGSKVEGTGPAVGDNSNVVEQPMPADSPTQAEAVTAAPLASDIPVQNLDSRLQDMLRDFHTTGDRIYQRSAIATEMGRLAIAGVPKPQIASALGNLFRDENSTEVKTDILNELGNLEDPSAYDQIVAGLDQHQTG